MKVTTSELNVGDGVIHVRYESNEFIEFMKSITTLVSYHDYETALLSLRHQLPEELQNDYEVVRVRTLIEFMKGD